MSARSRSRPWFHPPWLEHQPEPVALHLPPDCELTPEQLKMRRELVRDWYRRATLFRIERMVAWRDSAIRRLFGSLAE